MRRRTGAAARGGAGRGRDGRRRSLRDRLRPVVRRPGGAQPDHRPNIVLVLMDDFSLELLATMPQAQRLRADGATYRNAHVVDSLCCPSRAAIFTGRPPHQTGVLTNTPNDPEHPIGGYRAFVRNDNTSKAFNVALQKSGYTTGLRRQVHERLQHVHQPRQPLRPREDPRVERVQRGARRRLPRVGLPEHLPRQGRHRAGCGAPRSRHGARRSRCSTATTPPT